MPRRGEDGTLSDKTPLRMTLGLAMVIGTAIAGLHPWAVAQIRSVVQEENRVVVLQQEQRQDRQFAELTKRIDELTGEVRGLKAVILSRSR